MKKEQKSIEKKVSSSKEGPSRKKEEKHTEKFKCSDKLCPTHGSSPVKMRGRTFEGHVIRKLHGRVTIQFERMNYLQKYERYEKRKTKLHAKLPECMKDEINMGDLIKITETRPISKMIHFIVIGKVEKKIKEKIK